MKSRSRTHKVSVLFVCLGNICRSPTSEGVFRKLLADVNLDVEVIVDSAGTGDYHIGSRPDRRAIKAAAGRGIDLSMLRARRITPADFSEFDYIIGMDYMNYSDLNLMVPDNYQGRVAMFMEFAEGWQEEEVPDPYYGGRSGFERVLDMIEDASRGLLKEIKQNQRETVI